MRLKYLFFPIVLVLVVIIFWAYIWPEITSLQDLNAEYLSNQKALNDILGRKNALDSLSLKMKEDGKSGAMVLAYLPKDKNEEEIIGQVNYLAANAGVFLDNVKIFNQGNAVSTLNSQDMTASSVAGSAISGDGTAVKAEPVDQIQNTQAVITVNGDYDKLKTFFSGVQHMPIYNAVKSLKITSVEKAAQDQTDPNAKGSFVITAEMTVDFGYLKQVKADNRKIANFKSEMDSDALQKLRSYITGNVPSVNVDSGSIVGSSNPFLP